MAHAQKPSCEPLRDRFAELTLQLGPDGGYVWVQRRTMLSPPEASDLSEAL